MICTCLDCHAERIKSKFKLEDYRVREAVVEKTVMVPKTIKETKFYFKGKEIKPIPVINLAVPERRNMGNLSDKGFWLRPDLNWSIVYDDGGTPVLIAEIREEV